MIVKIDTFLFTYVCIYVCRLMYVCMHVSMYVCMYVCILPHPILSLIPSFSLPDVLRDPTDLIWRKGTPFEAMTGRTAPSSDVS